MAILYVQSPTLYLAGSGVIVGATSITLTDLVDIYGNVLTMSSFGSFGYITLEPDTSNAEGATFTGVTANANGTYTLTGVKTLLAVSPYTETSGLVRNHAGGTKVVVTDNVAFWNTFVNKNNTASISAIYTFATGATPIITDQPTTPTQAANKAYVDGVAIQGGSNASTTIQGFVQLPTQAQVEAGDIRGSAGTSYLVLMNQQYGARNYIGTAIDSGTINAYAGTYTPVPTALATGMVACIIAGRTNTLASTFSPNGLTAKNITMGATSLLPGVIVTNSMAMVEYNGTSDSWEVINVTRNTGTPATGGMTVQRRVTGDIIVPTTPTAATDAASKGYVDGVTYLTFTNGVTTKNAADASATNNIAHGLGRIPKKVRITATFPGVTGGSDTTGFAYAMTVYNGTTQSSVSNYPTDATPVYTSQSTFTLNGAATNGTQTGVVTFDATNIIITWTKTNSPTGTYFIVWEAE